MPGQEERANKILPLHTNTSLQTIPPHQVRRSPRIQARLQPKTSQNRLEESDSDDDGPNEREGEDIPAANEDSENETAPEVLEASTAPEVLEAVTDTQGDEGGEQKLLRTPLNMTLTV